MRRLKSALDAKGITVKGCAEIIGVSEKTMYNKMVGTSDFLYSETRKLKTLLPEYDIDYLLEDISGPVA